MISLDSCQRCGGPVIDYASPITDSPMCITCGWRCVEVSPEIKAEVEAHIGKAFMDDRYSHKQIATGKPPLSGWEREKRRRRREEEQNKQSLAAG